jgi:hypothetical protein
VPGGAGAPAGWPEAEGEHEITMSGTTDSRPNVGETLITRPVPPDSVPGRNAQGLARLAVAGIAGSVLIMIAASAVRNSWERPRIPLPAAGPPWGLSLHVSPTVVTVAMWAAVLVAGGSVVAGLMALNRGARLPVRLLLGLGVAAAAVFTVLPPTGSTDALDYAAYGRIAGLGHNPYVMTPHQLRVSGDPVGQYIPDDWSRHVTIDGPLATAGQWAAASLGGASVARIAFWLKLWGTIAFAVVVLALDRVTRSDPARRARAHLWWTANPLLLWVLVAAGHIDLLAAAAGFLGIVVLRRRGTADEPGALRGLAAGLLVGAAADIKLSYLVFGLGVAWAARRSVSAWLAAAAGGVIVLVPSYAWFGSPAVHALISRGPMESVDSFYQLFVGSHGHYIPGQSLLAAVAFAAVAALMLWRFPDGAPALPAVWPALAVGAAWLFVWYYQLPWYDAMLACLLAVYPASRLDWLVLARMTAATFALMPGNAGRPDQYLLKAITNDSLFWWAPAVLLAAAVALVWIAVSGRWRMGPPFTLPAAGAPARV